MRKIHRGLLIAMFPSLVMLLAGAGLKQLLLYSGQPYDPLPLLLFLNWRIIAILGMGLSLAGLILRNYPWIRDAQFYKDLGISMNVMVFLVVIPTFILLNLGHWFALTYYLILGGSVLLGTFGIGFAAAVIGEILYRWRRHA